MKESIVDIINTLAELTADKMPDNNQVHLPFTRKKDVFNNIVTEFQDIYKFNPPSIGFFHMEAPLTIISDEVDNWTES